MKYFIVALALFGSLFAHADGDERVVLRTRFGDLVLALFPEEAPKTVEQFLTLVRAGVYDQTPFFKVNPDFFAQVAGVGRRLIPLTAEQRAKVQPLKLETSSHHHKYGTVTMAHDASAPDNAESSFLILMRDVPEMDGKYAAFAEVESGFATLEAIRRFPTDVAKHEPYERIDVERAFVVDSPKDLATAGLRGPNRAFRGLEAAGPVNLYFIAALALVGMGLAVFFMSHEWQTPRAGSYGLVATLVGGFLLFAAFVPRAVLMPGSGPVIFFASLCLFKLMTRFERATL